MSDKTTILAMAPSDAPQLVELWEASVRATHHFLDEADIQGLKPLVLDALQDALDVVVAWSDSGVIQGFAGISGSKLEALFVDASWLGQGVGRRLLEHALEEWHIWKVDVNEGNPDAAAFYRKHGFVVRSRSETDSQGRPFPILHMELERGIPTTGSGTA